MSKKSKNPTLLMIIFAVGFIAIAAICLAVSIISEQQENQFMGNAESCTAQVKDIHTYTTRSSTGTGSSRRYYTTTHYDAYVSYTVNGVNYDNIKIPEVSSSVNTGDTLIIYYDPQNPSDVRLKSDTSSRWVSYIILSVFIVAGIVFLIVAIKLKKRISQPPRPQISAQDVIPDANSINSTATAYNGYNNDPQSYSGNQNIYNPNPEQTYDDYGVNPFDTYNGYSQNDNSNDFNAQQQNPFDTYNGYSQNDNSNDFNAQQQNPFDTYNGYSQNDNSNDFNAQQQNPFDTYNGYSQNDNSKPQSPFDRHKN